MGIAEGGGIGSGVILDTALNSDNQWHAIAAVGKGGKTYFYLDGVYVGVANYQPYGGIDTIGNQDLFDQAFAEKLDNIAFYNQALFSDLPTVPSGSTVVNPGDILADNAVQDLLLLPDQNASGNNIISIDFKATDNNGASSSTETLVFNYSPLADQPEVVLNNNIYQGLILDQELIRNGEVLSDVGWSLTGNVVPFSETLNFSGAQTPVDGVVEQSFTIFKDIDYNLVLDYRRLGGAGLTVAGLVEVIDSATSTVLSSQSFSTNSDSFQNLSVNFTGIETGSALLRITDTTSDTDSRDLNIDNISIQAKSVDNSGLNPRIEGQEDQPLALDLAVALVDTDNSEQLTVGISGAPAGSQLTDGVSTVTSTGALIDISGWNYSALQLTPPLNDHSDFTLTVTAAAVEQGNGDQAVTSFPIDVVVAAVNDSPVLVSTLDTAVATEVQVNSITDDNQTKPAIAPLADGGYISVWSSTEGGSYAIKARFYDYRESRAVTIADYSFESISLTNGAPQLDPPVSPWDFNGSKSGIWNPTSVQVTQEAPDGNNIAYATNDNESISQTLTETFSRDNNYQFQVEVGNRSDTAGFADYEVRLVAGGTVLARSGAASPAEGQWETLTLDIDGSAIPPGSLAIGQPLTIELEKISGPQIHFDNVRLTVSEPASELNPVGDEFRVDTSVLTASQRVESPQVAVLDDGTIGIVWRKIEPGNFSRTHMRTLSESGRELVSEFNIDAGINKYTPNIIALSDNRFLVLHTIQSTSINALITDSQGNILHTVNTGSIGGWGTPTWGGPEATALDDGGFALSWRPASDTADNNARIQFFDRDGSATTAEINFGGANPNGNSRDIVLDTLNNGQVVAAYKSGDDLFIQRWQSDGVKTGSAVQVNVAQVPAIIDLNNIAIEARDDGGFFVAWYSTGQDMGGSHGVYGRLFNENGVPLSDEILINTTTASNQFDPSIIELSGGNIQAVWTSSQNGNEDIYTTSLGLPGNQVQENANNGALVGKVTSSDPDTGDTASYALVNDAGGRFTIDSVTGFITVANGSLLDHEDAASHTVRVRATDSGGLTDEKDFTINVLDQPEGGTIGPYSVSSNWNELAGSYWGFEFGETNDWVNNNSLETGVTPAFGVAEYNGRYIELDAFSSTHPTDGDPDQLSLTIDTSTNQSYIIEFALAQRTNNSDTNAVDIIWDGQLISRVTPEGSDWNLYRVALPALPLSNSADLVLREVINDGIGTILDELRVYEVTAGPGNPITIDLPITLNQPGEVLFVDISDVPLGGSISAAGGDSVTVTQDGSDPTIWHLTGTSDLSGFVWTPAATDSGVETLQVSAYTTDSGLSSVTTEQAVSLLISPEGQVTITDSVTGPTLSGDTSDNVLLATQGSDNLTGSGGSDYFVWRDDVDGTAVSPGSDTITDFSMAQGDVLDLSDILEPVNNNISDLISIDQSGSDPVLELRDSPNGDITQRITLEGVDFSVMGSTEAEILSALLNNGYLNTD